MAINFGISFNERYNLSSSIPVLCAAHLVHTVNNAIANLYDTLISLHRFFANRSYAVLLRVRALRQRWVLVQSFSSGGNDNVLFENEIAINGIKRDVLS